MEYVEWDISGPCPINSIQDGPQGELGPAYTLSVDTRSRNAAVLGPLLNNLTLVADGTPATSHAAAYVEFSSSVHLLYVIGGTDPSKIKIDDWSVIDPGVSLAEAPTSIIITESANGTKEVSYGFDGNTDYQVTDITATTDTASANNETKEVRIFGRDDKNNRVIGLGGQDNQQLIQGNVLTGSVTMDASNWADIATVPGPADLKFTGITTDDTGALLLGTNYGVYLFDTDTGTFRPLMLESLKSPDDNNGRGMTYGSLFGAHIPLRHGSRYVKGGQTKTWGVTRFEGNQSPVYGVSTALTPTDSQWTFEAVYNATDDLTYLMAWRPLVYGDGHNERLTPFTIGVLASGVECKFLHDVGTANGAISREAIVGGRDTNAFYFLRHMDTDFPWEDSSYKFAASGTWFGTEFRGDPQIDKIIHGFEFEAAGCSANQTLQMKVSVDGATAVNVGASITGNGLRRPRAPERTRGWRITPSIAFATSASTASPRIEGKLRMYYEPVPRESDGRPFEPTR